MNMVENDMKYIFNRLSACFAMESKDLQVIVAQLVDQTQNMKLNKLTIQPIFKKIRKSCPKSNLPEMNTLLKSCYVLILSLRDTYLLMDSVEELLVDYPEFNNLPVDEKNKLLKFRNAMKVSLQLIDAKHHKGELLEIAGRLSGKLVTTGGSQTTETKRRVMIYEREGGLESQISMGKLLKKRKLENDKDEVVPQPKAVKCEVPLVPDEQINITVRIKSEEPYLPIPISNFIAQQLSTKFSVADAGTYQSIIERTIVQTTVGKELNKLTLRPILKELRKIFPRKEIWSEMNIIFKCCYVLVLSLRDNSLIWLETSELLAQYPYPEFSNLTADEAHKLLVFRNAMRLSLQLIDAKHHKGELLDVAGRLSGRVVTTGGGQTIDTTRCVMIYEQEGGISSAPRAPRYQHSVGVTKHVAAVKSIVKQPSVLLQSACLERADSFSLFDHKSLSIQSIGTFALPDSFGSINTVSESVVTAAKPKVTIKLNLPGSAVGTAGDMETDIDTELDSIEVATEVDESEAISPEHHQFSAAEETQISALLAAQEAVELQELLLSQTNEAFNSQDSGEMDQLLAHSLLRGFSCREDSSCNNNNIESIYRSESMYRSDSIMSVDMGISRTDTISSLGPDVFARSWAQLNH